MEKIREFYEKVKENRKYQIIFFLIGMLCICVSYFVFKDVIEEKKHIFRIRKGNVVFDENVYAEIESCENNKGEIIISGWTIKVDAIIDQLFIVLRGENEDKVYQVNRKERGDIASYYFRDETNEEYGFELRIDENEINKEDYYNILLYICYKEKNDAENSKLIQNELIDIDRIVFQQKVINYNPREFSAPNLEGQYAEIIQNGILREYDIKKKYWVYQYDTKLYYFWGKRSEETYREKQCSIVIMPATSIIELLPEHRRQYGNDNLGTFILDNVCKNNFGEEYFVFDICLPTEYPITYISTGVFDEEKKDWEIHSNIPMFDWRVYTE